MAAVSLLRSWQVWGALVDGLSEGCGGAVIPEPHSLVVGHAIPGVEPVLWEGQGSLGAYILQGAGWDLQHLSLRAPGEVRWFRW